MGLFYAIFEDCLNIYDFLFLLPFACHSVLWIIWHPSLNFPPLDNPSLISLDVLYSLFFLSSSIRAVFPETGLVSLVSWAGTGCLSAVFLIYMFILFSSVSLEICGGSSPPMFSNACSLLVYLWMDVTSLVVFIVLL